MNIFFSKLIFIKFKIKQSPKREKKLEKLFSFFFHYLFILGIVFFWYKKNKVQETLALV